MRTIPEVVEEIKSILNDAERMQDGECLVDIDELANEILAINSKTNVNRFPVGGVDRIRKTDQISLTNAVETPFWMAIWATEPKRRIAVEMSYDDLKIICDLVDKVRKQNNDLAQKEV